MGLHLPRARDQQKESYRVVPLFDGQEMIGRISEVTYWEGACEIRDASNQVVGEAYMELAGYDGHRLSEALNAESSIARSRVKISCFLHQTTFGSYFQRHGNRLLEPPSCQASF